VAEGPIKHAKDWSAWLRELGVQDVTGQDLEPTIQGSVIVGDVSDLAAPVATNPMFGVRSDLPATPAAHNFLTIAAKGNGLYIVGVTAATNSIGVDSQAAVTATGAVIPPEFVLGRPPDYSLDISTALVRHGVIGVVPATGPKVTSLFDVTVHPIKWYVGPGQQIRFFNHNINSPSDFSIWWQEIPLARVGELSV